MTAFCVNSTTFFVTVFVTVFFSLGVKKVGPIWDQLMRCYREMNTFSRIIAEKWDQFSKKVGP